MLSGLSNLAGWRLRRVFKCARVCRAYACRYLRFRNTSAPLLSWQAGCCTRVNRQSPAVAVSRYALRSALGSCREPPVVKLPYTTVSSPRLPCRRGVGSLSGNSTTLMWCVCWAWDVSGFYPSVRPVQTASGSGWRPWTGHPAYLLTGQRFDYSVCPVTSLADAVVNEEWELNTDHCPAGLSVMVVMGTGWPTGAIGCLRRNVHILDALRVVKPHSLERSIAL